MPVLLYGLEALDNKPSSTKSIDFAYNGVFVKIFHIKENYNILYCQRSTNCLPASCRLDIRTLKFDNLQRSGKASPLALQLLQLCGDINFDNITDKYKLPHGGYLPRGLIIRAVRAYIDSLL